MKTSERGVAFIAAQEGVVTRAYRDAGGVWTIGVGHTASAGPPRPAPGMTITREEAFAILARDLTRFEARVGKALPGVPQAAFDGAVSFDFNTGAIDRASWVAAFAAGDRRLAETRLMTWIKAGGRTLSGLVRRRKAEAHLIFDGNYGNEPGTAAGDVSGLQSDLAKLGFYRDPVDGVAGPATHAAILSYQRSHPDLVADGIAGPATRACIARDLALRTTAVRGIAVATAGTAVAGAAGSGVGHGALIAVIAGASLAAAVAIALAHRYGGELGRALTTKGNG